MLGCYDFCGHYDWTFAWMTKEGGQALLENYWVEAISEDSQRHAGELIGREGFEGMKKYWGHTLAEESPERGYAMEFLENRAWAQFHDCPSRGFLIRNDIQFSKDYCDHCIAWIRPVMEKSGFVVEHEHNHRGQCWWDIRKAGDADPVPPLGEPMAEADIRLHPNWKQAPDQHHHFTPASKKHWPQNE